MKKFLWLAFVVLAGCTGEPTVGSQSESLCAPWQKYCDGCAPGACAAEQNWVVCPNGTVNFGWQCGRSSDGQCHWQIPACAPSGGGGGGADAGEHEPPCNPYCP
jgi:hypothetical protein